MTFASRLQFARAAVRHPRAVGAVAPSSRRLAAAMVADLALEPDHAVLELGPGTGPFTAALRRRLPSPELYLGLETHGPFVARLRGRFPELCFVHGSAEHAVDWHARYRLPPVGAIVSGLPFASLSQPVQDATLDAIHALLRPGGVFVTFQYLHAQPAPAAIRFRRQMARRFGPPAGQRRVLRNLPPAAVVRWRRTGRYTPTATKPYNRELQSASQPAMPASTTEDGAKL
jgi:phospholipid N-methyltransferase